MPNVQEVKDYDWERYYQVVRSLQPNACIHVCGPDVRWCGNEAGNTRPSEWSVVPKRCADTEKIASMSQQTDDEAFRLRTIRAQDLDLGSRGILRDEKELIWYPAEVNTSIRPGWFWHETENDQVKPLDKLVQIYLNSVGGNATFLLNIPPDRRGLFHENDVQRLKELGAYLRNSFQTNLMLEASAIIAPEAQKGCEIENVVSDDDGYYFPAQYSGALDICVRWEKPQRIQFVVLQEHLPLSQRVEQFEIRVERNEKDECLYRGTTVGNKRIVKLEDCEANAVTLRITDSRKIPVFEQIAFY